MIPRRSSSLLPGIVFAGLVMALLAGLCKWCYDLGYAAGQQVCPAESIGQPHHGTEQHAVKLVCSYPMPYASRRKA